jgi:hypothetical protein
LPRFCKVVATGWTALAAEFVQPFPQRLHFGGAPPFVNLRGGPSGAVARGLVDRLLTPLVVRYFLASAKDVLGKSRFLLRATA